MKPDALAAFWPFGRKHFIRKYRRAYCAASVVLLGTYLHDGLATAEKARVESEVADMMTGLGLEARGWYATSWVAAGAFRALAMAHLDIGPIAGLSWSDLLAPWKNRPLPGFPEKDTRAPSIVQDYHPLHEATEEAKSFLRKQGLEIPQIGPWSLPRVEGGEPLGPGEHPEWRKNVDSGAKAGR